MKLQRLVVVITFVNLGLLMFQLIQIRSVEAGSAPPVLRGSALQIVDDQGRTRVSISILPGGRNPDGKTYPETAILRLIDPKGRPNVKLSESEQGSGLFLGGDSDLTYAVLQADSSNSSLKLINKEGRQYVVKP